MQGKDLTPEQMSMAVDRAENADQILKDFQRQHGFELPQPWQIAVHKLLLGGLSDPELHLIFDTYFKVEGDAGRTEPREPEALGPDDEFIPLPGKGGAW